MRQGFPSGHRLGVGRPGHHGEREEAETDAADQRAFSARRPSCSLPCAGTVIFGAVTFSTSAETPFATRPAVRTAPLETAPHASFASGEVTPRRTAAEALDTPPATALRALPTSLPDTPSATVFHATEAEGSQ